MFLTGNKQATKQRNNYLARVGAKGIDILGVLIYAVVEVH